MADLLMMEPRPKAPIQEYPAEHRYTRWGTAASIGMHVLVALVVFILAYLNHIKSLRDFMRGTPPQPPPVNEIEIVLPPDEIPPPPTDHPLFIKQIVQVPKPPPIIPPKIKPKPVPKVQHPIVQKHTVARAPTAAPRSQLVVGSGDLPHPDYPSDLEQRRISGTVTVSVTFDASGGVSECEVIGSSGNSELDSKTRHFILDNWHEKELAGQTQSCPIEFVLPGG